jgi:hypothetical protein
MTDRAKKIRELGNGTELTALAAGDCFVVDDISANTTNFTTLSTIRKVVVQGPYASDSAANTAGVLVGQPYYTSAGEVRVRIT